MRQGTRERILDTYLEGHGPSQIVLLNGSIHPYRLLAQRCRSKETMLLLPDLSPYQVQVVKMVPAVDHHQWPPTHERSLWQGWHRQYLLRVKRDLL